MIKSVDNSIFNEEKFLCIKGLAAIMICISHMVNFEYPSYLLFLKDGSIWVGLFLFITGYGLMYSYNHKEDYFDGFFSKKIKKIYIPACIAEFLYLMAYSLIFSDKISIFDAILGIFCIKNINTALWYIQLNIIINILFYFIMKSKFKNKLLFINFSYLIVMFILVFLDKIIGIDTWWYLSLSCLVIGFNIEKYKDSFIRIYNSKLFFLLVLFLTSFLIIMLNLSLVNSSNFLNINNNYFLIIIDLILNPIFTIFILKLFDLSCFKNSIFNYLGSISMYIYFYHRFFIRFYNEYFNFGKFYFCSLVIISTIVFCSIISFIRRKVNL